MNMIDGVLLTPLRIIPNTNGNILHALKASSPGFEGFGEVYFSEIRKGLIKGWKRHNRLSLNLVVPIGGVEFALDDSRKTSLSYGKLATIKLDVEKNYQRLTVPPGIWLAFRGLSETNILMNVLAEAHDPNETDSVEIREKYNPFSGVDEQFS